MSSMRTALVALGLVFSLSACQKLTGLEKLRAGPTPATAGQSAQTAVAGDAAEGGRGGRKGDEAGGAGAAAAGGGAAGAPKGGRGGSEHVAAGSGGMSGGGAAGAAGSGRNGSDRNNLGGMSAEPVADGGGGAPAPTQDIPATTPPRDESMGRGGEAAPPQGGASSPATEPPLAGKGGSQAQDPACTPPVTGATQCDTAPQCGCGSNEMCAFYADRLSCVRAGNSGINQPCSRVGDCQAGLQCLGGACLKLCDPAVRESCDDNKACQQFFGWLDRAVPGGFVCSSDCNLVEPQKASGKLTACGEGLQCVWSGVGSNCVHSERATKGHGEVCSDSYDCQSGFVCLKQKTCGKWCTSSSDCPSTFRCDMSTPATVAGVAVGVCEPSCRDADVASCAVNPQCGCGNNQACDFLADPSDGRVRGCRSIGSTPDYNLCSTRSDCRAGSSCIDGYCSPFCMSNADCGDRYAICGQVYNYDKANAPIPGFTTCMRPCDPADLSRGHGAYAPCPAGRGCMVSSDGRSYCRDADARSSLGTSCSDHNQCAPSDVCLLDTGCSRLCRTAAECPTGYACLSFSPPRYAATVEWGYCHVGS